MFNEEFKLRIHNALKDKPNYAGFSFGHKFTNGVNTKVFSIIVYVTRKTEVSEQDSMPETFEGIPIDVKVKNVYSTLTVASDYHCITCEELLGKTPSDCTYADQVNPPASYGTAYLAPLIHRTTKTSDEVGNNFGKGLVMAGYSGSAISGSCTVTLVAMDSVSEELLILGNQHCLPFFSTVSFGAGVTKAPGELLHDYECVPGGVLVNKQMKQGETDGGIMVGKFKKAPYLPVTVSNVQQGVPCSDPSVICYDADIVAYSVLPNIVPLPGVFELGDGPFEWITQEDFCMLYCGTPDCVPGTCAGNDIYTYKSGRTTGTQTRAEGFIVVAVDESLDSFDPGSAFGRKFRGVILIQHGDNADVPFGGGGDSGSPVLIEHDGKLKVLGVLTWGRTIWDDFSPAPISTTPATIAIAPIWQVASALNVKAWDFATVPAPGGEIVCNSTDPTITVDGLPYVFVEPTTKPITHVKD